MIEELRNKIDSIDDQIVKLYNERMQVSKQIGLEKAKSQQVVLDKNREKKILNRVTSSVDPEIMAYTKQVYEAIFATSKAYQRSYTTQSSNIIENLKEALKKSDRKFPINATVACQGVEGSYSSIATDKLFEISNILYFKTFEGVFNAVEKGLSNYGILPIENSSAGSVSAVYDLMKKHKFYIVRSIKLRVGHHLLSNCGSTMSDIKEIISHEQALNQCSELMSSLKDVKITMCDNTATAAKIVAESGRKDIACISSRDCAELYGLNILASNVQNNDSNYTRFICISKNLEVFNLADKISIMVALPHEKGSLNNMLNKFSALGLNLTKLESRPMANTDFEFNFYFDFEANIEDDSVQRLIAELDNGTESFTFLGSYHEVK